MLSRYSPRYAYASRGKNVDMSREHRRVTDGCTNKQRPVPMIYCHTNTKDERRHDGPANVTDRQTHTHTHTHTHTQTKDILINRQTHKHVLEGILCTCTITLLQTDDRRTSMENRVHESD